MRVETEASGSSSSGTAFATVRSSRAFWASGAWSGKSTWATRRAPGETTRPSETGLR